MVSDIIRPAHDDCVPVEQYEAMRKRREQALGEALRDRRVLEAIVRDLAAEEEPVADIAPEYGDYVCMVCPEEDDDSPGVVHVRDDYVHAARCAWLRSRAWVSAHPVSGDQQ